jgi:hypothetical protein
MARERVPAGRVLSGTRTRLILGRSARGRRRALRHRVVRSRAPPRRQADASPGFFSWPTHNAPNVVEHIDELVANLLCTLLMKTPHALAIAVTVLLLTPVVLGLGSFFVIPLVLLAAAVLPVALLVGIAALIVMWTRTADGSSDDFHTHTRPHAPLPAAR